MRACRADIKSVRKTSFLGFSSHKLMVSVAFVARVSNQNGVSRLFVIVEIHHSGRKPSICASTQVLKQRMEVCLDA